MGLPSWIYKRDGRLTPFEADKIVQALFAATERAGHADSFLAREMTDGVLHFLERDADDDIPTTAQVTDIVIKVVRELGQPALAQAFAEGGRQKAARLRKSSETSEVYPIGYEALAREDTRALAWRIGRDWLRQFSLRQLFSRDLVSAQDEGLISLGGLESPFELEAAVLDLEAPSPLEAIESHRLLAGRWLALDSPDHLRNRDAARAETAAWVRELLAGLRASDLSAVVNLNCREPPKASAGDQAGPLFAESVLVDATGLTQRSDELLDSLAGSDVCRLDWHLCDADFAPERASRLARVARRALAGERVAFVFDRPRRPIALGEGLTRQHSAVLMTVDLHLPRLADQPGLRTDPDRFLQKLGSLARMAMSAARQKREFLRRQARPGIVQGFLLERARLVVCPLGLDKAVQAITSRTICAGGSPFALQIVHTLLNALQADAQRSHLEACLDAPFAITDEPDSNRIPGCTPWDVEAAARDQIEAAGLMHEAAGLGSLILPLREASLPTAEEVVEWLRLAWKKSVLRLRLQPPWSRQGLLSPEDRSVEG